jgi:hypothetical protein
MHFASFDPKDPVFEVDGLRLSVQVVTRENVYGLDPAHTSARREVEGFVVRAAALRAGGGEIAAPGAVILRARPAGAAGTRLELKARARDGEPVRCVKLLVRGLAAPLALLEERGERPVGALGEILAYPNRLPAPLLCVRSGGETLGFRYEDARVREKRFAVAIERTGPLAGAGVVELVHEEEATRFSKECEAPPLFVSRGADRAQLEAEHLRFAERQLDLVPFEARRDVPDFARELALAITLHGMHWTGKTFLDYRAMLDALHFVARHVEGRRVLAYLPGWEGRYYWQYGDYRPEPRLGGEAGFAALCDGARALGVHLMPMFGANCVNAWLPRFRALEPSAYLKSATGNRFHGNQPDWDFSRAHDTGWQAWLNPGHPAWRDDLARQIESLAGRYGFDGVFLDTIHVYANDPDHSVFDGIVALATRLRAAIPGVLLAAEHDYDALLGVFPLFQRAYWGRDPAWTRRYALRFAHLCEGEPDGRTGVHEFGVWKTPGGDDPWLPGPGYLPTIAFQDDTLVRARDRVEAALRAIAAAAR